MNVEIADRLLKLRKKNGFSQEELAEKLGISRQAVSKWERAEASPDTDNLIRLAKLYGISLDELLLDGEAEEDDIPETPEEAPEKEQDWFLSGMKEQGNYHGGHIYERKKRRKTAMHRFPYPALVTIAYFFIGVLTGAWHPWWLLFLTIPLYYGIADGIALKKKEEDAADEGKKRKHWMQKFPYPILVTGIYLVLGFVWGLWHPWWVLFATIPIYYAVAEWLRER